MFLNNRGLISIMKYLSFIVQAIKDKHELNEIDSEFIADQVSDFVKKHKKIQDKIEVSGSFLKFKLSKEFKLIIKMIRSNLRKSYVLFQLGSDQRTCLFDQLKKAPQSLDIHQKLLETHRSTKERIPIYAQLYKEIFKITSVPSSIIDIGCGLNPLSFPWMNVKSLKYIASELNKQDLVIIQKYFKLKKINGKVLPVNLIKDYALLKGIKSDVCFMFKLLDSLEVVKKNITGKLLNIVDAKFIAVSFSTKSVGGKPMRSTRRKWFEYIASELGFEFKILEYDNELFYILSKTGFPE